VETVRTAKKKGKLTTAENAIKSLRATTLDGEGHYSGPLTSNESPGWQGLQERCQRGEEVQYSKAGR